MEEQQKAYRVIYSDDPEAKAMGSFDDFYQVLVGPDGFECWLCEPEDRVFCRDLRPAVDRLNEQHEKLMQLQKQTTKPTEKE